MAVKVKQWWDRQVADWKRAEAADSAKRLEGSTFSKDVETKMRQSVLRFAAPDVLRPALARDRYLWRPAAEDLMQKDEAKAAQVAENLAAALDTFHLQDECDTVIGILVSLGSHAVESILKQLDCYKEQGRSTAISVLGKTGDVRALNALTSFLFDTDEHLRVEAAQALQHFKELPTTAILLEAAWDEYGPVRTEVASLLERAGNSESIEILSRMLQDEYPQVRFIAARALRNLNWTPETDSRKLALLIAAEDWREVVRYGEIAIEPLLNLYSDLSKEPDVIAALLQVATPPLLEELIKEYGASNKPRGLILYAIEERKYSRAVPFILHVLDDLQQQIDGGTKVNTENWLVDDVDRDLAASIKRNQILLEQAAKALKTVADKSSITDLVRIGKTSRGSCIENEMNVRRAIFESLHHILETENEDLSSGDLNLILEIPDPTLQELVRERLVQRQ